MSDLTAKFTTLEGQMSSEHDEVMSAIADLQTAIDFINTQLDTQTTNNAANTKALLGALSNSGACFPCPTPSISVPPVGTGVTPLDEDRCKRSQAIIATIHNLLGIMDTMMSYNVTATFSVLNDAISQVIGEIVAGDTVPLPSFPEVVNLIGDYFNYVGERIFSGVGLLEQFTPLESDLVSAIYAAGSPDASQAAYNASIDASGMSNGAKLLSKAIAYNALWSYYFDPDSTPDLSGFDGGACGFSLPDITACTIFASEPFTTGDGKLFYILHLPPPYSGFAQATAGDFFGWTFEEMTGTPGRAMALYYWDTSDTLHFVDARQVGEGAITLSNHSHAIIVQTLDFNDEAHPFTCKICPPS